MRKIIGWTLIAIPIVIPVVGFILLVAKIEGWMPVLRCIGSIVLSVLCVSLGSRLVFGEKGGGK